MTELKDFIGERASFDEGGAGYIWGHKNDGIQMIAEVRGWGAIQNLFKNPGGSIDFHAAEKLQDELGHFIAEAITEKLNDSKDEEMNGLIEIHHEQSKELELEIQSLKEQLKKATEIIDQLTKQQLTNETNR